ncbi:hypothetical protein [Shewanella sp. 6_MG-2023]|uniref:hypothetical protein n=1 Tax=Shewanella sp. 6_MG-2023 TaxID=3062660 RepID=UPI0026E15BCC|nr:hypothetical protein [Shewanella sp. 6_MG-2023]MDO6618455.1 hypothetical protein [Shewanella sp. 6_MG-2023]
MRNGFLSQLVLLIMLMLVTANVFANNKVGSINLQCNDCNSDKKYQAAALSALANRQHAFMNVVNFSQFDLRKFEVIKLMVEVCSDYNRSATQGICQFEDRSTIIPLAPQNLEREQFITYAEYLYQQDFFEPLQIKVAPDIAATAWSLVNDKDRIVQINADWKRKITYYQFKKMWFEAYIQGVEYNTPIANLSPEITFEFADKSTLTSLVSGFDDEQRLHFSARKLKDSNNNQLSMTAIASLSNGDTFQFGSVETEAYQVLSHLAASQGFILDQKQMLTHIEVTLIACRDGVKTCSELDKLATKEKSSF